MPSQAVVRIISDTSQFDNDLRSELTRIINRIEDQLPPITIRVRLDDSDLQNQLGDLRNIRIPDIRARAEVDTDNAMRNVSDLAARMTVVGTSAVQAVGVASAALSSLGTAFATAGIAVGAFAAAAAPQLAQVTETTDLYTEAVEAAATGAEDAAEKQKAYKDSLAALDPATRGTAKAFIGLRNDFSKWSDSLASNTMPVFTQGIELLRSILPSLSPLVRTVSDAFSDLLTRMQSGVDNGGFKRFIDATIETARTTVPMLIRSFSNIVKGLVNIGKAFAPLSKNLGGGFESATESFLRFSRTLEDSQGFQRFLASVQSGTPQVSETFRNLISIVRNLAIAFAPFTGLLLQVTAGLAAFIAAAPPGLITTIAAAFTTYAIAVRLVAVGTAAATAANWLFTASNGASGASLLLLRLQVIGYTVALAATRAATAIATAAQWAWNAAMTANPIGIVIVAIGALVAAIVWVATQTTWFQTAWRATWNAVKSVFSATWNWIKSFSVSTWNTIKSFFSGAWNGIKSLFTSSLNTIKSSMTSAWNSIKTTISNAWNGIYNALKRTISNIVSAVKGIKTSVTRVFSGAASWLYNSGKAIIQGLIRGVSSMASAIYNKVKSIVSRVRNLLPFSPAKEGPFSGHGYTTYSGAALMQGLLQGIEKAAPSVQTGMAKVLNSLPTFDAGNMALAGGMDTRATVRNGFTNAPNITADTTANVTVMIGNRVVDQHVEAIVSKNNQARDRRTAQGLRF